MPLLFVVIVTAVATATSLCFAISSLRSHVNERRSVAGSLRMCLLNAATTTAVSLLGTLISMAKREWRSTRVAM